LLSAGSRTTCHNKTFKKRLKRQQQPVRTPLGKPHNIKICLFAYQPTLDLYHGLKRPPLTNPETKTIGFTDGPIAFKPALNAPLKKEQQ
jgi:hypothetical protein